MADEQLPPAPSETASEDITKSETIRITLPPKNEQQTNKRETVRINVPGKPEPKKETTKLPSLGAKPGPFAPPPAPTSMSVPMPLSPNLATHVSPSAPPPPPSGFTPPQAPGAAPFVPPSKPTSSLPPKPLSSIAPPPKPPALSKPTIPLKPAPSAAPLTPTEPLKPMGAAPKKETARIVLPADASGSGVKPALPKATVKMQSTQPLVSRPSAQISPAQIQSAPSQSVQSAPAKDMVTDVLAWVAVVMAICGIGVVFMVKNEAALRLLP